MGSIINKRIVYIDLMRAFAVIMMIQGHTIDTFLGDEYRTIDSLGYYIWNTLRGFTAPIFMFTAGLIFTYLLKADDFDFLSNPRIKKGVKRGITLITIGYLLRYPTHRVIDFSYVTQNQWDIFFTVDALHLIGFGLLAIILSVFFAKRMHLSLNTILIFLIVFIFMVSPIVFKINWDNFLPQYLSAYFYNKNSSLFPFFPWLVYVLSGAFLGNYLVKNEGVYFKKRFSFSLLTIGGIFLALSFLFYSFKMNLNSEMSYWVDSYALIFLRLGYVIVLNSIMAFIARKFYNIPQIIRDTGKKTLMLYAIHVIILYGCAWFPGLYKYYGKSFSGVQSFWAAVIMIVLMLAVVVLSEKFKYYRKNKVVLKKAKAM